ncbi:hypothetical protein OAC97_03505 [Flavobacteriaceae bacterium]|nr:hypothetical protein [Flavobacteriaceae bacterium]
MKLSKDQQKKIFFIDQTSEQDHHMVFNASIIKILQNIYNENIDYYGIESNKKSVFELLSAEQQKTIVFHELVYSEPFKNSTVFKFINYLKKEKHRHSSFKNILKNTTQKDIIFLSITTFTSFLLFKFLKKKHSCNVVAFLHGDIDFLYNSNTSFEKLNKWAHQLIFKIQADGFYYCVLNKISKEILVKDGFLNTKELMHINHPVEVINKRLRNNFLKKTLVIGHIGSLELKRKHSHLLYKLATDFKREIKSDVISFNAIGLSTLSMLAYKNEFVNDLVGKEPSGKPKYLNRITFENELLKLHFAIFFYPTTEYVFRASGAITDAIALGIPIIALKHPYFNYLFSKGGDIGYLCDSFEDIRKVIDTLMKTDILQTDKYIQQISNVQKLHSIFNLDYVGADLEKQLLHRKLI